MRSILRTSRLVDWERNISRRAVKYSLESPPDQENFFSDWNSVRVIWYSQSFFGRMQGSPVIMDKSSIPRCLVGKYPPGPRISLGMQVPRCQLVSWIRSKNGYLLRHLTYWKLLRRLSCKPWNRGLIWGIKSPRLSIFDISVSSLSSRASRSVSRSLKWIQRNWSFVCIGARNEILFIVLK